MKQHQTLRRGLGVLLALVMCLSLLPTTVLAEEMEIHIPINEGNFPDVNFRAYVSENFDTDNSGALSAAECAAVKEIKCSGKGITTLTGIGNFKQLTYLDCSNNQLAALNVSNNNNLTHLNCSGNQLTSLNVDYNTALEFLNCSGNQLTSLDLSNTKVTDLNADNNSYAITLTGGTFYLSKLPGNFGVSKASNWKNGTANGNILTVNSGATEVTYTYDCGKEHKVGFTLKVVEGYTVTFDANGGSGSMDAETVVSGSYTLPACTFTAPDGQQFKGWATSATGEVISGTITVTEDITLYAIWEDKACNETADFTSDSTIARALELLGGADKAEWSGTTLTLTLKGVDFTTTSPTAVKLPGGSTIVLVGDNIITTSEQPRTLSYGIDVTGGLTIEGSGTLTAMGAENADFSGGIHAENGVVEIKSGTVIAAGRKATRSSIGIYAYKVAISGGTVTATGGEAGYSSCGIYAYGSNIAISGGHVIAKTLAETATYKAALNVAPDLSAYTGYKWRTSSVDSFTSSSDKAYSHNNDYTYVEFSSQNTVTTYTVTFDANGGSSSMDAVTGVSGSYTLPANGFTAPEGKQFKGWATSATGEVIADATINVTGDTTLYAIWENAYTVTVESGGNGSATATPATAAAGTEITLTASPNTGYHFKAWQVVSGGVTITGNKFIMPDSNVTVTAIFEMDKYTVTFNANGGSVTPESAETDANGKLATLPTPTRSGYRFDGWYTAANGGEKITKDTVFTADTTVYAHWTKKPISGSSGSGSNSGTAIIQSAKTADIGVMIYGMTALLSLTGGAWMIGKKKEH